MQKSKERSKGHKTENAQRVLGKADSFPYRSLGPLALCPCPLPALCPLPLPFALCHLHDSACIVSGLRSGRFFTEDNQGNEGFSLVSKQIRHLVAFACPACPPWWANPFGVSFCEQFCLLLMCLPLCPSRRRHACLYSPISEIRRWALSVRRFLHSSALRSCPIASGSSRHAS